MPAHDKKAVPSLNGLIVFLRTAEPGKVKTRLAQTVGDIRALEIYQYLVNTTIEQVRKTNADIYLYFYPLIGEHDFLDTRYNLRVQEDGDLGQKMQQAFKDVLKVHSKAVIIGTDCPYLTSDLLNEAYSRLNDHEIVIGPAVDGGYYLLGLKKNQESLFSGIQWGTASVFSQTIEAIKKLELTYSCLPTLGDIDFEEDWTIYLSQKNL